jgi:hypothetical protein
MAPVPAEKAKAFGRELTRMNTNGGLGGRFTKIVVGRKSI